MKKMFISHSSKDKKLVEQFCELLQLGMGITRQQIFCTSLTGNQQSGKDYIRKIKDEIGSDWAITALITDNFLNSASCMMELGAAWALSDKKTFFPILVPPINYEKMDETLLKSTQMLSMDKKEDLLNLYDECCNLGLIIQRNTAELYNRLERFFCEVRKIQIGENIVLTKNSEGYYETEITAVREVPEIYRCYRIRGRIELEQDYEEGETHWIFYHAGMFPELSVGEHVIFKVSKTELRQFEDLGNARNIYPAALKKATIW